jgi:hypothetical protein
MKNKRKEEEDCDDIFLCFYDGPESLNCDGAVYISEGIWMYPDGTMESDDDYDDNDDDNDDDDGD